MIQWLFRVLGIEKMYYQVHYRLTCIEELVKCVYAQGVKIMSAISDFAASQAAFNTRMGNAIDGLVGDVASLNDKITELQNSQGQITPGDQALLDDLQVAGNVLADKLEALDNLTPPVPPIG